METTADLIHGLRNCDNKLAYVCLQELLKRSEQSNEVYAFFEELMDLTRAEHSYQRTRGMLLIATNARWDRDNLLDENIDELLERLPQAKPIEARQWIRAVGQIAAAKPDLSEDIAQALGALNTFRYPGTMQKLIREDIADALNIARINH